MKKITPFALFLLVILLLLSACTGTRSAPSSSERIPVVATTTILADVVSRVGGDQVAITTLVPPGSNEHEYQPSPQDIAAVADAALVFEIGRAHV